MDFVKNSWWLTFGAFFSLGSFMFAALLSDSVPVQPIRYNHAIHISNGLGCEDCHVGARRNEKATLPGLDTCMQCHSEAVGQSPEEAKVRSFAGTSQPIPWVRIMQLPEHVYFSHRRHVALGGMKCAECHGPMETRTEPPTKAFRPMKMDNCIECHRERKASNDCNDCHR